jgi:hypothetical protein
MPWLRPCSAHRLHRAAASAPARPNAHRAFALTKIRNENIARFFEKIGLKCAYIWYFGALRPLRLHFNQNEHKGFTKKGLALMSNTNIF